MQIGGRVGFLSAKTRSNPGGQSLPTGLEGPSVTLEKPFTACFSSSSFFLGHGGVELGWVRGDG